jgi:hypothetical protein
MRLIKQLNPEVYLQAEMDGVDSGYFVSPTFSRQTYLSKLTELPSVGYQHDDKDIGGAVLIGNKLHLAVTKQHKGLWAFLLKPTLSWAFSHYNPLIVCISSNNYSAIRLLDATSFRFVESKDGMNTYEISPKELT